MLSLSLEGELLIRRAKKVLKNIIRKISRGTQDTKL